MEQLIINIFKDVLMRAPTSAEISAATTALSGGQTAEETAGKQAAFVSDLVNSPESVNIVQPIAGAYGAIFGRTPDKLGLDFWVNQHRNAEVQALDDPIKFGRESIISVLELMVNPDQTTEFGDTYGAGSASGRTYKANDLVTGTLKASDVGLTGKSISNGPSAEAFIDGLYDNILGRPADAAGRAFWISQYNKRVDSETAEGNANPENAARAFIIDSYINGEEFEVNIGSYLVGFLNGAGLDPDPVGLYADPDDLENAGSLGNDAPELDDVTGSVAENADAGTVVATLSATDRDFNDDGTFSIVDNSGNFEIDGDNIVVKAGASLDFETATSFEVLVTATDVGPAGVAGLSDSKTITINITDVDENTAPTLDTTTASVTENASDGTTVATLQSTDPDADDTATYTIESDPSGLFEIEGDKLVVKADANIDFETATSHVVSIKVTDSSGLSDTSDVTVSVSDVVETPDNAAPVLAISSGAVLENAAAGTPILTLQSTDADTGDSAVYSIDGNSTLFQANGNQIVVRAGAELDFETATSHDIDVTVTDSAGATDTKQMTIDVINVNEAPSVSIEVGNDLTIPENSPGGTIIVSLSVVDPDLDDTTTLSLVDPSGLFEINEASNITTLQVKEGADIDFETASSHTVTVVATDESGLTDREDLTITVTDVVEAQEITLTTDVDTPSDNSAGVNTLGGEGVDNYIGLIRASDASSTMNSTDVIDGAGGEDSLVVRIIATPDSDRVTEITTTNVESITFKLQPGNSNAFATVNLATADNVEELWVKDSPGNADATGSVFLQVNNLNPGDLKHIGLENVQGNVFVNLTGQGGRENSTDDAIKLMVDGAKQPTGPILFMLTDDSGTVDKTFEILNIESTTNASEIDLFSPMDFTSVNVTGDAHLVLSEFQNGSSGNNFETLETVDASGMTGGGLDINARGATAADFSFTGSEAADRLEISRTLLSTASNTFKIDGGDEKDTVAVENFSLNTSQLAAINAAISIEVLESYNRSTSLDVDDFDTIKEFVFAGATTGNQINVREIEDDTRVVFAADHTSGNAPVVRFSGERAGTELFMELRSDATNGGTEIHKTGSSNNNVSAIDFTDISSVNIASTGEGSEANVITADKGNADTFVFDNDNVSNFAITGTQDLTIGAEVGASKGQNRDVRGFTESVNVDASSFEGVLRIAGSTSGDKIEGGSGDDIIYGLGDDDELTGNAGADQFRFSNNNDDGNVITDFKVGEDKVGFHGEGSDIFADFNNTTATAAGAEINSADYVENRSQITLMGSNDSDKIVELREGLDGGQITSDTSNSTVTDALVLVFNLTTEKAEMWYDSDWSTTNDRSLVVTFDNIETLVDTTGLSNTDFVEYLF